MDLAQKAKRVVVVMNHVDKYGNAKIVSECTLPLTSKKCVDLIITDMAVMEVTEWTYITRINESIHSRRCKTTYRS